MKKSSILIVILFCMTSFARVYTISIADSLRGDYFYTLATMLENIPELESRVLDGTDTDLYRLGKSGRDANALALYINGIKSMDFQDGSFCDALRPVANQGIDSIVVYTGVSASAFPGNYGIVIDMRTVHPEKPSFSGATYVGSEVGDPTIYLHLLEGEKPYNKEQLASGELWGSWRTGSLMHDAGFVMTYMDRYSNGHEDARSTQYGLLNANNSLCEVRKGRYDLSLSPHQSSLWDLSFFGADYNLFRFDTYDERYRFYTGRRAGSQISGQVSGNRLSLSMGARTTYEEGHDYESQFDSTAGEWGSVAYSVSLDFPEDITITIAGDNEFGTKASEKKAERHTPENIAHNTVHIKKEFLDSSLTLGIGYPLQAGLHLQKTFDAAALYGGIGVKHLVDSLSTSFVSISSELYCGLEANGANLFTVGIGLDRAPQWNEHYLSQLLQKEEFSYWGSVEYRLANYLKCYFHGSNYLLKGGVTSTFSVRGLKFGGGVQLKSKSYWDTNNNRIPISDRHEQAVLTMDPTIRGSIRMSYGLFQDHLRVAIAVRDLGKVKKDLPQGSLVGPVIVSNILFQF